MTMKKKYTNIPVNVIGGGLAGCEAAYSLVRQGIKVRLYEMRPAKPTPAHKTGDLAELVCSNSLKSQDKATAQGLLKQEMRRLGSLILKCADQTRVPAGTALAVDRRKLARMITRIISSHPDIEVIREEVEEVPEEGINIIATGPLTSEALAVSIRDLTREENLFYYDAVAPVILAESLDYSKIYRSSRYGKGTDDYLNCPLSEEEYRRFYQALIEADSIPWNEIDQQKYFEGCMPIEVIARRDKDALRFGPMRPVGLPDPASGVIPYAVVQLRFEDQELTMVSPVGFQTRMRWGEQEKVLRLIPGLEKAEFVRLGVMHRNTYINSPRLLTAGLEFRNRPGLFFAGQITGVEGYMESAATGIVAGINAGRRAKGIEPLVLPNETIIGGLCRYITNDIGKDFQPMNANFGLLPPLEQRIKDKKIKNLKLAERAINKLNEFCEVSVNGIVSGNSIW